MSPPPPANKSYRLFSAMSSACSIILSLVFFHISRWRFPWLWWREYEKRFRLKGTCKVKVQVQKTGELFINSARGRSGKWGGRGCSHSYWILPRGKKVHQNHPLIRPCRVGIKASCDTRVVLFNVYMYIQFVKIYEMFIPHRPQKHKDHVKYVKGQDNPRIIPYRIQLI
jgi:hypothetical protein